MRSKLLFLIIGFMALTILAPISCREKSVPERYHDKFKVIGLKASIFKAIYSDTSNQQLQLLQIIGDTIEYGYYAIQIIPDMETYLAINSEFKPFDLIQSAYARNAKIFTSEERIDSIVIESTTDFDDNHPAGQNLADVFDVVFRDGIMLKFGLQEFTSRNPFVPSEFTLILQKPPKTTKAFEFKIKLFQKGIANNNFFETKAQEVVISKDCTSSEISDINVCCFGEPSFSNDVTGAPLLSFLH